MTKTLATLWIAKAEAYEQLLSNRTSSQQTAIQNVVVGFLHNSGFGSVTLSASMIAEDETAFKESGNLLEMWQDITAEMYPTHFVVMDCIPRAPI